MPTSSPTWLTTICQSPHTDALCERIAARSRTVVQGSRGSSTSILCGALAVRLARPLLLVVAHADDADNALEDLVLFGQNGFDFTAKRFGAMEGLPGESALGLDVLTERLALVTRLSGDLPTQPDVLVAPIQALMQAVPVPDAVTGQLLTLQCGADLPPGQLVTWLADSGYTRVEAVEQPGDFAPRGGIVDIYPTASITGDSHDGGVAETGPVRVDYFGDEIESIRRIDTDTMGSGLKIDHLQIVGASPAQLQTDDQTTNILSLLAPNTVPILHEVMELSEQARGYFQRLTNPRGIYPPQSVFKTLQQFRHVEVNQYSAASGPDRNLTWPVEPCIDFDHDAVAAINEVTALTGLDGSANTDRDVHILCSQPAERDRLMELIAEHQPDALPRTGVEVAYLHRGFTWCPPDNRHIHLIPHHELFHRYHVRRRFHSTPGDGSGMLSDQAKDAFLDVVPGDHVVHIDHGIARFAGLRTMRRKGKTEEYLTLEFAGKAQLHVPATQIDLVQKYIGGFHGKPPLSSLGGKRWAKQKRDVADAVKDLAAEMLRIQAARASQPGIRYPPDTAWQNEFEAEFPYQETQDQLTAIAQLKTDMTRPQPMDRLVCGDVGFGKTEVAIRAAFKAVEYGKQVAVLVPTTVLAEQHERTFKERFADYPFKIESLSRFKTNKQVAQTLRGLAEGGVDVVIGTHRLLSDDIHFADLGLVIVDEEQRFGVEHKQKLMRFRLTVDVLTLTATPIPRTLHLSMLGLRDISSLTTAPLDRRAIVTEVIPYNAARIRQAVIRELNRDGQVFFVHNRVHSLNTVAAELRSLVPEARIAVGHGQMPGRDLEQVMLRFLRHEADVLACTTIIESGIDIPTANTIFINQADRFGLAELHQLRGRVGRYKHRAYCYLLLPEDRPVTDTAARRLRAIEQYAMLGAGFKIAMRDLEIRGAGNILGPEQSGHIATVGYQMYCHLLERATQQLRNEQIVQPARTHLELPLTGQIPKRYIPSEKFRIEAYRRLSRAATLDELANVARDLTDAYGPPPEPARALIDLTEVRIAACTLGIDRIKLEGSDLIFTTASPKRTGQTLADAPGRVTIIDDHTVYFRPPPKYLEPPTLLAILRKLLTPRTSPAPTAP